MRAAMPGAMKAVVAYAPGDYRYEEVEVPRAGRDEVIIKVEACGICAGDIKAFQGGPRFWGGGGNPCYIEPPMIPGHEFIGRVVEIGEQSTNSAGLKLGDRVAAEQIVPCGSCRYCRNGHYWLCQPHVVFGFKKHLNGGFAEYVRLPGRAIVHQVPTHLPLEAAVLIEPYSCSMHAIDRAGIGPADVVVISGAGPLGLGMIAAARLRKPAQLIALDLHDFRLDLAKQLGCDLAINPRTEDAVSIINDLTDGYGCDVYIEATGYPASVTQGIQMIKKAGRFVEFGVFNDQVTCDWSLIGDGKELDILGVSLSPHCYPKVIRGIAAGELPTAGVVTHKYGFAEFEQALATCLKGEDAVKVVLVPD